MRRLIFTASMAGAMLAAAAAIQGTAFVSGTPAASETPNVPAGHRFTNLNVVNVSCVTCAPIVKAALSGIRGVTSVSVEEGSGASAIARVVHNPRLVTSVALAAAVTKAGFPAKAAP